MTFSSNGDGPPGKPPALRMLYSSNAFWAASGYGVQGKSLLPRLAELPEFGGRPGSTIGRQNIAQFAWYGLQGGVHHVDGFRVYPVAADPYGNDIIGAHTRDFGANLVVSLIDVWVMHDTANRVKPALWCPWLPIDHDPIPQKVLESLQGAHLPLTYAKWGHKLLNDAGVANHYIPHGIETDTFRPLPRDDRLVEFKRGLTLLDDCHLTVMVAANKGFPDRKAFQVQLRAWKDFAADKPNARLYIHSEPTTIYQGIDFVALVVRLGLEGRVIFPDRYRYLLGYPVQWLAGLYNVADIYLGASMSEGFGIPLIEAQGCGTPVITTDFSAMPELVRWGYAVPPMDMVWSPMGSWQAWPDHRAITDRLNDLYAMQREQPDAWRTRSREASEAIHAEYDWSAIVRDQWRPLIRKLAGEVVPLATQQAEPDPLSVQAVPA